MGGTARAWKPGGLAGHRPLKTRYSKQIVYRGLTPRPEPGKGLKPSAPTTNASRSGKPAASAAYHTLSRGISHTFDICGPDHDSPYPHSPDFSRNGIKLECLLMLYFHQANNSR